MIHSLIYGAALLVALLLASPALDRFHFKPWGDWKPQRIRWRDLAEVLDLDLGNVCHRLEGGESPVAVDHEEDVWLLGVRADQQRLELAFFAELGGELLNLGIAISRAIQRRDPTTGVAIT